MRLKYKQLKKYLFDISKEVSTDGFKAPKILHLLWSIYDTNFKKSFPIDSDCSKEYFLHWILINIKNTEVFYKNEIIEALLSYNHTINAESINFKLTPIQALILGQRSDLQTLFPDITGEDNVSFWNWWINDGYKDYGLDSPLSHFESGLNKDLIIEFFDSIDVYRSLNEQNLKGLYSSLHIKYIDIEELTPFMVVVWKTREDLKKSFENIYSTNQQEYIQWWKDHGEAIYSEAYTPETSKQPLEGNGEIPLTIDKSVAIIGHATGILGLGEDARLISKSLESINIANDLYSLDSRTKISNEKNTNNVKSLGKYGKGYFANIFPLPANDIIDTLIRFGVEPFFGAKYNICVVQWELEYFPKEYEIIKYLMDRVCSISTFSAQSIEKTLNVPVSVIPLPFRTDVQPIVDNEISPKCTFYFAFDGNSFISRKNPLAVIAAFQNAFKKDEDVELIVKVMNSTSGDLWNECLRKIHIDKRITLIDELLSKHEYMALLKKIDCVVSLHRSEGFGRVIAEAMLLEKPVVVSNYSGNLDYTSESNSFLVKGDIVPLFEGDYQTYQNNNWFEANIDDASKKLIYVYKNRNIAKKVAKKGREFILDNYNFSICGAKIKSIIGEIITSESEVIINESGLFDKKYYSKNYNIKENAIEHYIDNGVALNYNPSAEFDTKFYKEEYPDVMQNNLNPFVHYIMFGKEEGRACNKKPSFFDVDSLNMQETKNGMIFISHEATRTGAPLVVLDLCREYAKTNGDFVVILMAGGELQDEFEKLAPVVNLNLSLFNKDISVPIETMELFSHLVTKGYNQCIANSVLSGFLQPFLDTNCINTSYLVHEMPELIDEYNFKEAAINIANSKCDLVFSSHFVSDLFCENYATKSREYNVYPQGIHQKMICKDKDSARRDILRTIGCKNPNARIILAAGLAHDRKGTDLFIEVAQKCCIDNNRGDIEFIWLGDKDNKYKKWFKKIYPTLKHKSQVHFIDFVDDPSFFFGASDLFLLTSREDPLPGVGLIAMKNEVPLVMFKGTGGIEEYITSTNGKLVDQFDTNQMASIVLEILDRGMEVASNIDINTSSEYFDKVMSTFDKKSKAKISVVVPNYNYEKYLPERLNSIINQTHKVDEILFLDDCSADDSVNIARDILEKSGVAYQIIVNKINAGVYRQWLRGFELAKNDLVWIAEADDFAEEDFLETLVFMFDRNKELGLAYSQSTIVDGKSELVEEDVRSHTNEVDGLKWNVSYINKGNLEIESSLLYRNTIPNVSACLINKKYLKGIDEEILKYKYCGDWYLYTCLLNKSNIGFCHRSLNHFRKHMNNVTTTNTYKSDYIDEVLRVKKHIYSIANVSLSMHNKMLVMFEKDFITLNPDKENIKVNTEKDILFLEKQTIKSLTFVTFNKEFGGSEVMWFDLVNSFNDKDIKLSVLCPDGLLDSKQSYILKQKGIEILESEEITIENLSRLSPSYVLFSIGDHNDGGEYFEYCQENNVDYAIINQLVKKDMWTTDNNQLKLIFDGYKNANATFFTCQNNIDIFNLKMGDSLTNSSIHFNPISINRDDYVVYPKVEDNYCLAFPGRLLTIHKGQDILINVLSDKKWKERNIVVNFYGVGPDEVKLKALAGKYNLKNVNFCGYVNNVRRMWEDNHAFILTSHMEGIPIVLLGAMFAGRTAIVTDVGGNKEVIIDAKTGFIAKEPTIKSVDKALENAWNMRDDWEKLGRKAREDIKSLYPLNPLLDFKNRLRDALKW